MNKTLLLFVILLLLVPIVSADVFRQDVPVEINHPIRVEGATTSTAKVNISIKDPFNNPLVNFSPMTYSIGLEEYTFSLSSDNTNNVGEYTYCITATDVGFNATDCFEFVITPSGQEITTGQSMIYLVSLTITFLLFLLALYGAIVIPFRNERNPEGKIITVNDLKYVKLVLWFTSYMLIMFVTFLAWNITHGFLWFNVASRIFEGMFWVLASLFLPAFIFFLTIITVNFLEDKKLRDGIGRGL